MTIITCPRCDKKIPVSKCTNDFVHECIDSDAGNAQKTEDVFKLGSWEDYTGSGGDDEGATNLQGLVAPAGDVPREAMRKYSDRGNNKAVFRERRHQEYIKKK